MLSSTALLHMYCTLFVGTAIPTLSITLVLHTGFMILGSCAELHLLYLGWHDKVTTDYSPHGTEYMTSPPHVSCYILMPVLRAS